MFLDSTWGKRRPLIGKDTISGQKWESKPIRAEYSRIMELIKLLVPETLGKSSCNFQTNQFGRLVNI